jgi:hypothetical protein
MLSRLLAALGLGASIAAADAAPPPAADPLGALRPLYERLYALPAETSAVASGLRGRVVEVAIGGGIDVLAVYPDGRLRYLNHAGRPVIVETPIPALAEAMRALWRSAGPAADRARPWVRDTRLQRDPQFGPVLLGASEVLARLTQALR